jgi:lipid II:glycine glycyltransferase (peptidoglycan interpeptide bridge formation enzyme)
LFYHRQPEGVAGSFKKNTSDLVVSTTQFYNFFLKQYRAFGRKKNCDFVRINPLLADTDDHQNIFRSAWFRPSSIHMVNPEHTWILDLDRPLDEVLAAMKKKRRAESRSAKKFGAETTIGNQKKDLDIFWELHQTTVTRQRFVPFPRSNTEKELQIFGDDAQIFSTKIDDKFYSSALILFDKKSAYYHQGSSSYHKAPVARINLWAAIQEAHRRGCKQFNFWGIIEDDQTKHPWYGLSQFKKGFGGSEKKYLHCQDGIIKRERYWLNYLIETYRRWKKGY